MAILYDGNARYADIKSTGGNGGGMLMENLQMTKIKLQSD
jgi:hypothetical protein